MAESVLARLWNAVKPPLPVTLPDETRRQLTSRQKRLLRITAAVLILGTTAWGVFTFATSAPQRANRDFEEGMRLMQPRTYPQAIERFNRAIETSPQLASAYLERGIAHHYLNQTDQALTDFDTAIDLNSNLARAYSERALIYRQRGDSKTAIEEFTKSLGIEESMLAYYERGQTYELLGQHQKAIDDYDNAIAWMRDSPEIYRARSLARKNLGDLTGYAADRDQARIFEHRR